MNANLFARLAAEVKSPDRVAVETLDGEKLPYSDLFALTGRLANLLVARGVKPGDRVAAHIDKSVPALMLPFAVMRAGAVYLPLNNAYTLAELDYFLKDAQPALVVCDPMERAGVA